MAETPTTAQEPEVSGAEVIIPEVLSPEDMGREQMITRRLATSTKILPQVVEYLRDPEKGQQQLEKYRDLIRALRAMAIHVTFPSDWILHYTKQEKGPVLVSGYLQDIGCERVAHIWGISRVSTIKGPTREVLEDKTYIMRCEADFFCERSGIFLPQVRGSRWSGESFFVRKAKKSGDFINPLWVEESSLRNMHGRAVRALAGLAAIPADYLAECGLDVSKCQQIHWAGAREATVEGEQATRGEGVRNDLFALLKDRARQEKREVSALLRDLCKQHGMPEKNAVSDLTDSQAADLLIIVRELPPIQNGKGAKA